MLNQPFKMQKQQKGKQKNKNDTFLDLYKKFNEVNDAATQQKKVNEVIDLIDDTKDEDNLYNNTFKTELEDIFINDNSFDDFDQNDKKDIKMVSGDILQDKNLNQDDVLFGELPTSQASNTLTEPKIRICGK